MHLAEFPGEKSKLLNHPFDEGSYLKGNFKQVHKAKNLFGNSTMVKTFSYQNQDGKVSYQKKRQMRFIWNMVKVNSQENSLNIVPRGDGVVYLTLRHKDS